MARRSSLASAVCVLALAAAASPSAQPARSDAADPVRRVRNAIPGRYIVVLRGADDPEAVGLESARLHRGRLRRAYRRVLRGFSVELPDAAARALARDPRVAYVEEDGVTHVAGMIEQTGLTNWGLDRVDSRAPTLDQRYRYSADGTGVNVYIVDTGVRVTHATFEGRAFGAYNAVGDEVPSDVDCYGHGTHVAGIAAGAATGVAKGATVYSVKALGCSGSGTWSDYIEALDWVAANHRKPAVVNASIGGGVVTSATDAIDRLVARGVTFVGAAGNHGYDACDDVPGYSASGITVASVEPGDRRAWDSNHGTCVDIFAPGGGINSASAGSDTEYYTAWGTSMAAPHVAGAAALYLQRHPSATPKQVREAIVAGATRGLIADAGAGTPNLLLFTPYLGDVVAPTLSMTSPAGGATVSGTVTVSASAADDAELARVTFAAGGTTLGVDTAPPFAVSWDTTRFANTPHTITAEARDLAGNVTRRTVTVTVANGAVTQGWASTAVGTAATGRALYSGDSFVVEGAGSGLWGTADALHLASRPWTGDGDVVVYLAGLVAPSGAELAMAGVTFRESSDPSSRHASLVVTTEGKLKFRRRAATGGSTSSDGPSAGSTFGARWLKLTRRGNVFAAFVSGDGVSWQAVHTPQTIAMGVTSQVGVLVLRTGGTGAARATFENVGIGRVPARWSVADVGAVGTPGATTYGSSAYAMSAGGRDLWASTDAFHLAYQRWTGDGEITARIESLGLPAGASVALAGITMRESLAAGSRHASLIVTTSGKVKLRRRTTTGGATASDGPSSGSVSVPRWVRLKRAGNSFTAYISADGVAWQRVHTTVTVGVPSTVYVGLVALRSGGSGTASARFESVTVK